MGIRGRINAFLISFLARVIGRELGIVWSGDRGLEHFRGKVQAGAVQVGYTVKKVSYFSHPWMPLTNSPWPGVIKIFPAGRQGNR